MEARLSIFGMKVCKARCLCCWSLIRSGQVVIELLAQRCVEINRALKIRGFFWTAILDGPHSSKKIHVYNGIALVLVSINSPC